LLKIAPEEYQSTPNLGTDGGIKLNSPSSLKCGIFNLGNSQSNLKNPFILSIAPPIISFIFPNISEAFSFTVSQFLYNAIPAVTKPATTAITARAGPIIVPNDTPQAPAIVATPVNIPIKDGNNATNNPITITTF